MKVNFNYEILDMESRPMLDVDQTPAMAGKILANALVMQPEGEIIKYFDWALRLHRGEIIDLDRTDQNVIKEFIKNSRTMVILVKVRLLEAFDKKQKTESNGIPEMIREEE